MGTGQRDRYTETDRKRGNEKERNRDLLIYITVFVKIASRQSERKTKRGRETKVRL